MSFGHGSQVHTLLLHETCFNQPMATLIRHSKDYGMNATLDEPDKQNDNVMKSWFNYRNSVRPRTQRSNTKYKIQSHIEKSKQQRDQPTNMQQTQR